MGEWRVRVRGPGGEGLCGAGVFIGGGRILTCAHVVTEALGLPDEQASPAGRTVLVDFAPSGNARPRSARTVEGGWFPARPASGDIAVLELGPDGPPAEARPAALFAGDGSRPTEVSVYGHPSPGLGDGVWVQVTATGSGGPNPAWRQLDGRAHGVPIKRGFSGAGVWDRDLGGVIGLVVAAYGSSVERVAWMFPLAAVAREWTPLAALLTTTGPASAELTARQCAELAALIASIPKFGTLGGRQDLVSLLRPEIGSVVTERPEPHAHLYHVVRTSTDYEGGLDELVCAVRTLVGDSRAVRSIAAELRRFAEEGRR
ncbi:trypsin-like peptidase domain-containing protein [Streptomyces sp. NPDC001480]|uniref:effector-associated domain 2-containing protein n=1 Tax=Streptomyces sp. NPDC001480 TaxID=3364577 RepID=UPI00368B5C90